MFRELGIPHDDDWQSGGSVSWIDQRLRAWTKEECQERVKLWQDSASRFEKSISRLSPYAQYHVAAISIMSATRLRLDRELLLLVGQAEELGIPWTALAEALVTSPQNAHKVYGRRLMDIRGAVAKGWSLQSAIENFYPRRGG
ncbi:hypothetical protein O7600_20045 [Micromonospora sp. WMMA1998]|uniref:hypothetical protein n=1 Tax=Micromonospora sp. WMMA1998 TaxID=3015167 RepID=UPI00248CFD7C|nr:hypothetical protein [Micromonospora sp. WMMA1998]WBC13424.1 hypothetical protein O7600_20045 [Micromonospora sp. WMMA1998]